MCDHVHFKELENRVLQIEKKQDVHEAASTEKFKATEKIVGLLVTCFKWVFGALFVLLLIMVFTVAYGAIGERGLNSVSRAVQEITH